MRFYIKVAGSIIGNLLISIYTFLLPTLEQIEMSNICIVSRPEPTEHVA